MNILRVVLSLLIPTVLLVEGFTSNKRTKEGIVFSRPEHLRYANLEKSSLFTNHMEKQQLLERLQVQLQSSLKSNHHSQATSKASSVPSSSATTTPRRPSSSPQKGHQTSQPSSYGVNNRHASKDWLYNLKSLPKSSVLKEIRNPVLTAAGWSTVISIIQRIFTMTSNPMLKSIATNMSVPHSAHSFLVSSLGLLLVFRTNSAYQRFLVCVFQSKVALQLFRS
jgi:Bestrophin, RFP-TM, chloride channel